jgi:hypothetical protein
MTLHRDDPTIARLREPLRRTHDALFQHPAPADLLWGDVRALLCALAEVRKGRKGVFKATRRGVMATFRGPRDKMPLSAEELAEVRSFLERSKEGVSTPVLAEGTRLLVAIDIEGAKLFRIEMRASVPRGLAPFQANGYPAHLFSSGAQGSVRPQPVSMGFYRNVARALRGAGEILLVACGEGGASAMEALRDELAARHAEVSRSVVGTRVLKGGRASEERLLAEAGEFYSEFGQGFSENT